MPRERTVILVLAAVLFAALAGGAALAVVGFLWFAAADRAEAPPPPPPPPPAELPAPPPEPAPPAPETPTRWKQVWAVPHDDGGTGGLLAVAPDGKRVFAQDPLGVRVLDGETGVAKARLAGDGVPTGPAELMPVGADRVLLFGPPLASPALWHAPTGTRPGDLVHPRALPIAPAAPTGRWAVSADGKFFFAGAVPRTGVPGVPQFRVFDTAAGQPAAHGFWTGGNARFSADGTRLFVAEAGGQCRWLRVPGGVQEAGWTYPAPGTDAPLAALSADGKVAVYHGRPAGLAPGRYLIAATNGQVLRALDDTPGVLTADGRWLVGVDGGDVVVTAARTGTELPREPLPGVTPAGWAVRPDGRDLLVYDGARKELLLFSATTVPPLPPTPTPPAISPVPDPLPAVALGPPFGPPPFGPPFGPQIGPPQVGPPVTPKTVPPAALGPAPPQLAAKWNVAAEIGTLPLDPRFAPQFAPDGATLIQHGGGTGAVLAFDAADGAELPRTPGLAGATAGQWAAAFGNRAAAPAANGTTLTWQVRTGVKVDPLAFPELPPGSPSTTLMRAVSPTGRYTVLARRPLTTNLTPQPLRVLDTTTGEVILDRTWPGASTAGGVAFTADELRLFVLTGTGKGAWHRLPSGALDSEWEVPDDAAVRTARLVSMTADGSKVVYSGPLPGGGTGGAIRDGKTGAIVRRIDNPPYQPSAASLSPDGRLIALPVSEFRDGVQWHVDVLDVATWRTLGRASPPREHGADVPLPRFAPDGKAVAVMFRNAKRLGLYAAPDPAP